MEIKRSGSQPSNKGSNEWFTGDVAIDLLFRHPNQRGFVGRTLHSSQVLAQHGTPIL